MNRPVLTLFYDGLCPLCSREVAYFRRRLAGDADIRFLDITEAGFDARSHGLDPQTVQRWMHVKVGEEIRVGLDAFVAVWQRTPGFGWLARLAGLRGIRGVMAAGYRLFAILRPWLPRRRRCEAGTCLR
jgi:predicted DCC family thiol-disulfide oxidoreductase YuxK